MRRLLQGLAITCIALVVVLLWLIGQRSVDHDEAIAATARGACIRAARVVGLYDAGQRTLPSTLDALRQAEGEAASAAARRARFAVVAKTIHNARVELNDHDPGPAKVAILSVCKKPSPPLRPGG